MLCNTQNDEAFMYTNEYNLLTLPEVRKTFFSSDLFDLILTIWNNSKSISLLQAIFDQYDQLFTNCVSILACHSDKTLIHKYTEERVHELAKNAAIILQTSAATEKLLISGFLGVRSVRVLVECVVFSASKSVREITLSLLKCFEYEILSANFGLLQDARLQCLELFTNPDSILPGSTSLNRVMLVCKTLGFRRDHAELMVKTRFLQDHCHNFYHKMDTDEFWCVPSNLKCAQNIVEIIWDGTSEACFTFEILSEECLPIVDLHFQMLRRMSQLPNSKDPSITRLIRIGLSVMINCHMDYEQMANSAVREGCPISVLNCLLDNEDLNQELHAAALDLVIRVSQPFEVEQLRAPPRSIHFLMDHIDKCLNLSSPPHGTANSSTRECEATTPTGVRLPARNYFKTLTSLCQCEQNRDLIFTAGALSLAQKMLTNPFNYDDVIYPMSLMDRIIHYPEVSKKVEQTLDTFQKSNFYTFYGRECSLITSKMDQIRDKIDALKNNLSEPTSPSNEDNLLSILYTACGPVSKSEQLVVDFLKDKGYLLKSFHDLPEEFCGDANKTRETLTAQYQVLLVFLRTGMNNKPHLCLPNLMANPINTNSQSTNNNGVSEVECYTHLLSYFSLTERKSFLLVATEEEYSVEGWVEFTFETTRIFNTMLLRNFEEAILEELKYIKKYEQKSDDDSDRDDAYCPWLHEFKQNTSHEQDALSCEHPTDPYKTPVTSWNSDMLQIWLRDRGIVDSGKLSSVDGKQFLELARLRNESYEIFWNEIRSYFKLSMQDCLALSAILKGISDDCK
ncbi:uncharacterized protein LOC142342113 [Convolutriloba macropyga]|uniref:uncharacterized protein LOC142342113 n=1 Tax=Convolutriloba macropyga TaxID=536237 RepID=UPI003F5220E0